MYSDATQSKVRYAILKVAEAHTRSYAELAAKYELTIEQVFAITRAAAARSDGPWSNLRGRRQTAQEICRRDVRSIVGKKFLGFAKEGVSAVDIAFGNFADVVTREECIAWRREARSAA
jgi:hypothetical protein